MEWLKEFAGKEPNPRYGLTEVYGLDGWAVATDTKCLAAMRYMGTLPSLPEKLQKSVREFLEPVAEWQTIKRADLAAFVGTVPTPCDNCGGLGYFEHECNCDMCECDGTPCIHCDETGRANSEKERCGVILGKAFDLFHLAKAVRYLPKSETVEIALVKKTQLYIVNADWLYVLMALHESVDTKVMPVFTVTP